jgi:citrate lyase beta subunit
MGTTLPTDQIDAMLARLAAAQAEHTAWYPGESGARQPVHTVYGGAHLFKSTTAAKLGELALKALDEHAPDAATFAAAIGLEAPDDVVETMYGRVLHKLQREPIEDFRIDFEDGYGNRPDDEEDGHARAAAAQVAAGMKAGSLPPFIGIRIKPLTEELGARSIRTLDVFTTALAEATGGELPANFVVTLPKITSDEHVAVLTDLFDALEPKLGIATGALGIELMIETTQSIMGRDGRSSLPLFLAAARGRCVAAHFGTYDYTASCNITAAHQHMTHSSCDFARHMMQVAYAGTGIWLSDGATNIMPVGDRESVHEAWRLHVQHIWHSLTNGYYQGWDLHPAQLPTRYGAVYAFFLEALDAASERLTNFIAKAAQATLVGDVFDDAATGQGLLNFFLRGVSCGAIKEEEALATGITLEELRGRSFVKILANRKGTTG